jgi:hypothetical protein
MPGFLQRDDDVLRVELVQDRQDELCHGVMVLADRLASASGIR